MPTLTQTLATLDRLHAGSETHRHEDDVRKWLRGVDSDTHNERFLDGRAQLTAAASRARGYSLLAQQRRRIEEDRRCR